MTNLNAISRTAGDREAGAVCPHCDRVLQAGNPVAVCPTCGTAHHEPCWQRANRCGSYICAPARRDLDGLNGTPALVISAAELAQAVPLPATRVSFPSPPPPPPPRKARTNGLAIAALVCAVAGIPFFGLLTGLVAILLASFALGAIRTSHQKGTGFALTGLLLGLADMVGWSVLLVFVFWHHAAPGVKIGDFHNDLTALDNLDPKINRAMRANVLIESRAGGVFGGTALGSGVILRSDATETLIISNRHVVDPDFSAEAPARAENKGDAIALKVYLVDESVRQGRVVWIAPDGIDLALVRVEGQCPAAARVTQWQLGRQRPRVGDPVFAIGNPHGLGWTHTQGTVSQYRIQDLGGRHLSIIQTQTVINPGNSGGGLYDQDGYLIGINTWTKDKRVSEGLNFAIALEALATLRPPMLPLSATPKEPE